MVVVIGFGSLGGVVNLVVVFDCSVSLSQVIEVLFK